MNVVVGLGHIQWLKTVDGEFWAQHKEYWDSDINVVFI